MVHEHTDIDPSIGYTFAVWLAPDSHWRERYAGWPVLRKLEYVDGTMREIAARRPTVVSRARIDPLSRLRKTLRQHYVEKRRHYGLDSDVSYDRDLRRVRVDVRLA